MKSLFTTILVSTITLVQAQFSNEVADSLQKILEAALPPGHLNPGAVMNIYVPGEYNWSGAAGYSVSGTTTGIVAKTAVNTDHFRVGSLTKLMVATSVLLLEETGQLSITDDISLYLRSSLINDTIQSSTGVTIEQLLNHTSGIANAAANQTCQQDALSDLTRFFSLEEAVNCGASQGEEFVPGSSWSYSNTNYTLLAMIIEEVTAQELKTYLQTNIFVPLNLQDTYVPESNELTEDHLGCYWQVGFPFGLVDMSIVSPSLYKGWADVVSTTEDLTRFLEALLGEQIISEASLSKMEAPNPESSNYGLGMELYTINPDGYQGHSGEVGNTSGLFYSNLSTNLIPNGYYISYNFTYQGASSLVDVDQKVYTYLKDLEASPAGFLEGQEGAQVDVYPNPTSGIININTNVNEVLNVRLYSTQGQLIKSEIINGKSVDYSGLDNGIYILSITSENQTFTKKITLN